MVLDLINRFVLDDDNNIIASYNKVDNMTYELKIEDIPSRDYILNILILYIRYLGEINNQVYTIIESGVSHNYTTGLETTDLKYDGLSLNLINIILASRHNTLLNDNNKLYIFHSSNFRKDLQDIDFTHYGSELGSGFYCAFNTSFCKYHRNGSRPYINIYELDILKACSELKVGFNTFGINNLNCISNYDIFFDTGRSNFCRSYGGQIIFKNDKVFDYLKFIGCFNKSSSDADSYSLMLVGSRIKIKDEF